MPKTELTTKTNTGFLILGLMVLTLIGFYPTYISKFPYFDNITNIHHFHGAMMMAWLFLLIAQPFLIRYNRYETHRTLGKASYIGAPLVLLSIFLASRDEYFRDASRMTEDQALAGLALDMSSIAAFGACSVLILRQPPLDRTIQATTLSAYVKDIHARLLDRVLEEATAFEAARRPSMQTLARELRAWLAPPPAIL